MDRETTYKTLPRRRQFVDFKDLKRQARGVLPAAIYNRLDGGAGRGVTIRANQRAFDEVTFRVRQCVTAPQRSLHTTVLGERVEMPVITAPCGSLTLFSPRGGAPEVARAAASAGTIAAISMFAGHTIEQVASQADGPLWLQVYLNRGRDTAREVIRGAREHGAKALAVTIDMPTGAEQRDPDVSFFGLLPHAADLARRPRWLRDFVLAGMDLEPLRRRRPLDEPPDPVTWHDFGWIRDEWQGPLVIKGILGTEDAKLAVEAGADAIVVSNHGGTVVDGTPATLSMLQAISAAVGDRVEVLLDGGIRSGADVVKALALGARAVLIGQAYVLGLSVGGEAGVRLTLDMFRTEMDHALSNIGRNSVQDLDPSAVDVPPAWSGQHP